eukprot:c13982_g1_i1 orf=3-152(-)
MMLLPLVCGIRGPMGTEPRVHVCVSLQSNFKNQKKKMRWHDGLTRSANKL